MKKLVALALAFLNLRVLVTRNSFGDFRVVVSYGTVSGYVGGRTLCLARGGKGNAYERVLRWGRWSLCNGLHTYISDSREVIRVGAPMGSTRRPLRERLAHATW